jgi:hypothetical protein
MIYVAPRIPNGFNAGKAHLGKTRLRLSQKNKSHFLYFFIGLGPMRYFRNRIPGPIKDKPALCPSTLR